MQIIIGSPISTNIPFWRMFGDLDGAMFNAYDIMSKRGLLARVERSGGLKKFLGLRYPLWIDSGGYQLMKKEIPVNVNRVAEAYSILGADFYISLDRPTLPGDDPSTRLRKNAFNVRNFEKLYSVFGDKITPVIHYSPEPDEYDALLEVYIDEYRVKRIAFGGFVPPLMHVKGSRGARLKALLSLIYLRKAVGSAWVHVMGAGAPTMIPILEAVGVDSTDSSTWRVKAAYGKIILPWGGERHASPRKASFGGRAVTRSELSRIFSLMEEVGFPFAEFHDPENLRRYLAERFENRAVYNLWVIVNFGRSMVPRSPLFRNLYFVAKVLAQLDADEILGIWRRVTRLRTPSLSALFKLLGLRRRELAEIAALPISGRELLTGR